MSAAETLGLVAVVVGLAVGAEMIGDRLGLPNFLFFILAGLALGPVGLGLVHHEVFGKSLGVVVGLGVAIIIFHSGTGITREALGEAPRSTLLLTTVGVLTTFLGSAAVVYLAMDVTAPLALLIGALLVATGTTVIEPLLESVPVREELAYMLEIEATVTEVSAGVLAITVFNAFALGEPDTSEFVFMFGWVLAVGVAVGLIAGGLAWALFTLPDHAPHGAPKHATQLYLATAIITYAAAELIAQEAGVAAVATAGVVLGNVDLPYERHIATFEEDFTTFVIAFIFVVLASFVEPDWVATVGLAGLVAAVGVILLVRPLAVGLSTVGSTLSNRERLFLTAAGPRGIIPAGVATLLALQIQDGNPTAAVYITGTVLLVIVLSATVEGLFAGRIAERFGLTVDSTVVVGGGRVGLALADRYAARGERVVVVESDWDAIETARNEGFTAYRGDGTEESVLRDAGVATVDRVVAATDDDETNREIAALVRSTFDVDAVLVRINEADDRDLFDDLDVELLTGSQLELWSLKRTVDQSAPDWLTALTRTGGLGTVTVANGADRTVADVDESLPGRAFVIALTRDGRTWIPEGSEPVEDGDRVTLLGTSSDVEAAIGRLDDLSVVDAADVASEGDATD